MRLVGNMIRIYIQVCIWQSLIQKEVPTDQTLIDLVSYTVIAFLIERLTHNETADTLAQKVKEGSIAIELIRPFSLKWYLFYQQLSENTFSFLFIGLPVALISAIFWHIRIAGVIELGLGFLSIVFAIFLSFNFQYAIGLLVFWVKDATYTRLITGGIVALFSGSLIPLWFYPETFKKICNFLPFRYMMFEPISIFLGQYTIKSCLDVLVIQLFWIVLLSLLAQFIWKNVQKSITIQGG